MSWSIIFNLKNWFSSHWNHLILKIFKLAFRWRWTIRLNNNLLICLFTARALNSFLMWTYFFNWKTFLIQIKTLLFLIWRFFLFFRIALFNNFTFFLRTLFIIRIIFSFYNIIICLIFEWFYLFNTSSYTSRSFHDFRCIFNCISFKWRIWYNLVFIIKNLHIWVILKRL